MAKEKQRKIIATITTIAMILGCLVIPSGTVSEAASNKLKVTCKKTVAINCTTTIKTNVKAKFKSSNKKIATVSSKGVVKGKKAGKVKITVTSKSNKKLKKTVTITVKNQLVINAPTDSKATLYVGESTKIKTNLSSKFKSSDSSVATVNSSGKVVAKKAGTSKITVTSKSNKKLKKTVTITVKNKPDPTTEATTTEKPNTDVTPDPEPGSTTENTTDKPTTEEQTTTEQQTTEENPSTEEPTEPEMVGVTAKYRGDKVPNGSNIIMYGIDLKAIYNDGTEETIIPKYENYMKTSYEYIGQVTEGESKYAKYKVSYLDFSTEMKVEVIDVNDIPYPVELRADYIGEDLKEGESLDLNNIVAYIRYNNKVIYEEEAVDSSKLYAILDYDYGEAYDYVIVYDYIFEDNNGNELYACVFQTVYIPYE